MSTVLASTPAAPSRRFWRRRLVDPLTALLTQGVTPERVAATLAVGTVCSLFPFLGLTSLLNLGVGLWLRMNQPVLHTLNQLLSPVHFVMIFVYVRLGEWIWRVEGARFNVGEMIRTFHDVPFGEFLERFGWAGVHAFTAWLVTAPLLLACIHYPLRPVMLRLAALPAGRPSRP